MQLRKTHLRVAGLALLLVAIGLLSLALDVDELTDPEALQARARESLPAAAGLFLLTGFAVKLLFVPASPLTVVAGLVFGAWIGSGLALLTLGGSSVLMFGLARWLGRDWARDQVEQRDRKRLRRIERLAERHGFVAVVIVRLVPILPLSAANALLGLTPITWRDFVGGSLLGFLPGVVLLAHVGDESLDRDGPWFWIYAGAFALLVIAGIVAAEILRRRDAS